jgi:hypothetical protein
VVGLTLLRPDDRRAPICRQVRLMFGRARAAGEQRAEQGNLSRWAAAQPT